MSLVRSLLVISCAISPVSPAYAETARPPSSPDEDGIAEGSSIVVTATRPNHIAPVTASLTATQPQAIVSRSYIEDTLPATADVTAGETLGLVVAERLMAKPEFRKQYERAAVELRSEGIR